MEELPYSDGKFDLLFVGMQQIMVKILKNVYLNLESSKKDGTLSLINTFSGLYI